MDAEHQACGTVARESLSLRKLLREFSVVCDNRATVSLWSDRKEAKLAKHIDIVHHFARILVANGELKFVYCKSKDNASDCLSKALPKP
jgi:hypothetical protein